MDKSTLRQIAAQEFGRIEGDKVSEDLYNIMNSSGGADGWLKMLSEREARRILHKHKNRNRYAYRKTRY